jgi:hypothetical protein
LLNSLSPTWRFPFQPLRPSDVKGVNGTRLRPNALDCTTNGQGVRAGAEGGCGRTAGFATCTAEAEADAWEGGWGLHRRRVAAARLVCGGPISKIYCALVEPSVEPNGGGGGGGAPEPPAARFCWVERLFAPEAAGGAGFGAAQCVDDRPRERRSAHPKDAVAGRSRAQDRPVVLSEEPLPCRFVAYCEPTELWAAVNKKRYAEKRTRRCAMFSVRFSVLLCAAPD